MKSGSAASSKSQIEEDEIEKARESKSIKTDESSLETQNHLKMIDMEELIKEVGTQDGHKLVALLRSIGVGEQVELYKKDYKTTISIPTSLLEKDSKTAASIPTSLISEASAFQAQLQKISTLGRSFEISIEGDRINIDLNKRSKEYISSVSSSEKIDVWVVDPFKDKLESMKRWLQNEFSFAEPSRKLFAEPLFEYLAKIRTERRAQVTLENSRGILPGEMAITSSDSTKPILGTYGAVASVAVTVYNTETKIGTLSHIDDITNIDQAVSLLCMHACNEPSTAKLEVNLATRMPVNDTLKAIEAAFKDQRDNSYPNLDIKDVHVNSCIALDTRNGEINLNLKAKHLDQGLNVPSRLNFRRLQADLFLLYKMKIAMDVKFDERPFQNVMKDESQAAASSQEKTEESNPPILVTFSRKRELPSSREGSPSIKKVKVEGADSLISAEIKQSVSSDETTKNKLRPPAA